MTKIERRGLLHPLSSAFSGLSLGGSRRGKNSSDVVPSSHIVQHLQGDPEALSSQVGRIIPPACSGSVSRVSFRFQHAQNSSMGSVWEASWSDACIKSTGAFQSKSNSGSTLSSSWASTLLTLSLKENPDTLQRECYLVDWVPNQKLTCTMKPGYWGKISG